MESKNNTESWNPTFNIDMKPIEIGDFIAIESIDGNTQGRVEAIDDFTVTIKDKGIWNWDSITKTTFI